MRKAENLPSYRAVVMKPGSLNFLEPSGPAQACYGRALLYFYVCSYLVFDLITQVGSSSGSYSFEFPSWKVSEYVCLSFSPPFVPFEVIGTLSVLYKEQQEMA